MLKIRLIDLIIFPNYCGDFTGEEYIEPKTGEKNYFSTLASEELVDRWRIRAEEVKADSTRMIIHLRDASDSSGKEHLIDFVQFLEDNLEPTGRYFSVNGHNVESENLKQRTPQMGLVLAEDIRVVGYGHHRGDCVPERGRKATLSLGLDESVFEELGDLSVGDKMLDRLDIIRQENPQLFGHYSDERVNQLREQKDFKAVGKIFDARKYLFVYCSAEQVREAARLSNGVEDFETNIGGTFKGFNFLEDYFELRKKYSVH